MVPFNYLQTFPLNSIWLIFASIIYSEVIMIFFLALNCYMSHACAWASHGSDGHGILYNYNDSCDKEQIDLHRLGVCA